MSLVQFHGHHNRGRPASTLTSLKYLNVRLDAQSEHIIAAFLLSSATRNTIAIGLLDPYVMPSVSIQRAPVQSNITKSIVNEIHKHRIPQHWDYRNLSHTVDWDESDRKLFKQARERTTTHMEHLLT